MKFANVKELQRDASKIIRMVEQGEDVIVTKRGKPAAVIYPMTEEDIEDYIIEHSPTIRRKIEAGMRDLKAGRTMPLEELLKKPRRKKRRARP